MLVAAAIAGVALPLSGSGEPVADVLTRCQELAAFIQGRARELPALCRPDRFPAVVPRPPLAANEQVIWRPVAGEDPRLVVSGLNAWRGVWPPATGEERELGRRSLEEPAGVGTYYAMHGAMDRLVRRDVAWLHLGRSGVLWYERERPWDGKVGALLTGKWLGAYSVETWTGDPGGSGVTATKVAGTASAIGLQDGARWYARLYLPEATLTGEALVHENRIRWTGRRESDQAPAWWSAEQGTAVDQIEGVLTVGTSLSRQEYRLFLKRAPADP